jgi:integral membrane protein
LKVALRLFRAVALFEGITTLLLFLVAMPVKYWFGNPVLVPPVGMTHGIAFLGYIGVMPIALLGRRAGVLGWLRTFAAAFVPFGTFLNDSFLQRLGAMPVTRRDPQQS